MKWIALLALIFAIAFGAEVVRINQISLFVFIPNLIAFFLSTLMFVFSSKIFSFLKKNLFFLSTAILFLLFLTLLFNGQDGVHRWFSVGVLNLNVSMSLAPVLILGVSNLENKKALAIAAVTGILFIFQPDVSQATAFTIATSGILISRKDLNFGTKIVSISFLFALAVTSYFQLDTLSPVPQVEEVLRIAFTQGGFYIFGAVLAVLLLFLPFLLCLAKMQELEKRIFVASLSVFWIISFIWTELGFFPVPVIGAGAAGVFGFSISYILLFGFESEESALNLSKSK